jgi:4-amino-4-deoxy-L-arabinose transferase-like glycosyltransferase
MASDRSGSAAAFRVAALLLTTHLLVFLGTHVPQWSFGGTPTYLIIAHNLVTAGSYSLDAVRPTCFRSPLYTLFLAAAMRLFGDAHVYVVPVLQAAVSFSTGLLVYFLTIAVFGSRRAGLFAAVLYGVHVSLLIEFVAQREAFLFTFLLVASAYVLVRADGRRGSWGLLGVLAGLAYLCRPTGIAVLGAIAFSLAVSARGAAAATLPRVSGRVARIAAVALLVASPWLFFTYSRFGRFLPSTSCIYGHMLLMGNNALISPAVYPWVDADRWTVYLGMKTGRGEENEIEREDRYVEQAVDYIGAHPGKTALMAVLKVLALLSPISTPLGTADVRLEGDHLELVGYRPRSLVSHLVVGPYILLLYLGILGYVRHRADPLEIGARRLEVLTGSLFLVLVCSQALSIGETRYRLPLDPLLMVFAAGYFDELAVARGRLRRSAARDSRE